MAKLRLFASLREIAGTSSVEIEAGTVADLVGSAGQRFGPDFVRGAETSRVWLNGREASMADAVTDQDEVVLLPPVSGGSSSPAAVAAGDLFVFLPVVIAVLLALASTQAQEVWAAALVAAIAVWALDIESAFRNRGRLFAPLAVIATSASGALAAHIMGGVGYGMTVAVAVAITLGWAVAFANYRQVDVFSPTLLVALLAGLASASLVLVRSDFSPDQLAVRVFLAAVVVGVGLGALVARMPNLPLLDPFSTTAISAVLASIAAAAIWDLDMVGYLLVGLGLAVALVAGLGLSSMLRSGRIALTERPPGLLASVDGVVLAAAVFYPLVRLVI